MQRWLPKESPVPAASIGRRYRKATAAPSTYAGRPKVQQCRRTPSVMGRKLPSLSPAVALCASWLLLAGHAAAATVISARDADTLRVEDAGRKLTIRVACIDASEMAQSPTVSRQGRQSRLFSQSAPQSPSRCRPETATEGPFLRCSQRTEPTQRDPGPATSSLRITPVPEAVRRVGVSRAGEAR